MARLVRSAAGAVVEFVARGHDPRLLLRHLHQGGVELDGREAVVLPVPGDHGLRGGSVELGAGRGEAAVEARLLRRLERLCATRERGHGEQTGEPVEAESSAFLIDHEC